LCCCFDHVRRSNWPSIVISVFATNSEQEL
jgi:hypothetical protein